MTDIKDINVNCKSEDKELRKQFLKLYLKVEDINERTKKHTIEIRNLKKELKTK